MGEPGLLLQEMQHEEERQDCPAVWSHTEADASQAKIRTVYQPDEVCKQYETQHLAGLFANLRSAGEVDDTRRQLNLRTFNRMSRLILADVLLYNKQAAPRVSGTRN